MSLLNNGNKAASRKCGEEHSWWKEQEEGPEGGTIDMPKRGREKVNTASVPCTRQRPVRDELGALERARY